MKKSKKILMATVAILLCLVLLSSSIVSGIYAKFVITKSAELPVKFKAFGVEVELIPSNALITAVGGQDAYNECAKVNGNSVSITIDDLAMRPGVDLTDAIRFKLTGTPNTRIKLVLDIDIDYDPEQFKVPYSYLGSYTDDYIYVMPIGFERKLYYTTNSAQSISNTSNSYYLAPWMSYGSSAWLIDMEYSMFNDYYCGIYGICDPYQEHEDVFTMTGVWKQNDILTSDLALETVIGANQKFGFPTYLNTGKVVNDMRFSIRWPFAAKDGVNGSGGNSNVQFTQEQIDKAEGYICREGNNPTISVSYTIRIEQVADNYYPTKYSES